MCIRDSIDGVDWGLVNPWIEDGCLEYFSQIINDGVKGTLVSTVPPFTLPAWTSMFTGVNPGKHGITDNLIRLKNRLVPALSRWRGKPLIWSLIGRKGLKSIVVNDPVTYPPEPINGIMVTGFLTPPNSEVYTYPPEIKDEIDKASGGYIPELPPNYGKLIAHNRIEAYNYIQQFAQKTAYAALYLMKNYEWNIFNVTFTSTDRLQHFYFHEKHLLKKHYMWLDSIMGKIMDLASNENANIIVVSDHGFAPIHKSIHINTILAKEGLIKIKNNKLHRTMLKLNLNAENITRFLKRMHLHEIITKIIPENLKQTLPSKHSKPIAKAVAKLYTGAGIFINKNLCHNYQTIRNLIIQKLLSIKDNNRRAIAKVYKREEVLWGPYITRAPDLFVIPKEGYYLSTAIKDKIFSKPIQPESGIQRTGDHRMKGIFIAYGPDIKEGIKLKKSIFTWDVAPLILHMLGLPIPNYMDGHIRKEIFKRKRVCS